MSINYKIKISFINLNEDIKNIIYSYCYIFKNRDELRYAIIEWVKSKEITRKTYGHISGWDVSKITDMEQLFAPYYVSDFTKETGVSTNELFFTNTDYNFNEDISRWDVSNVTNMREMFYNCKYFNQTINKWDVSKVISMYGMFFNTKFNNDISKWDVSNVTSMVGMFFNCQNFNQTLNDWNVNNVIHMSEMFSSCVNLNQDFNKWKIREDTFIKDIDGLFEYCNKLDKSFLKKWNKNNHINLNTLK